HIAVVGKDQRRQISGDIELQAAQQQPPQSPHGRHRDSSGEHHLAHNRRIHLDFTHGRNRQARRTHVHHDARHKVCRIIRTGTAPDKTDEHADNDGGQNRDEFAEHKSTLQQPEKRVAHISRQTGVRFLLYVPLLRCDQRIPLSPFQFVIKASSFCRRTATNKTFNSAGYTIPTTVSRSQGLMTEKHQSLVIDNSGEEPLSNFSDNATFAAILDARQQRRSFLKGGVGAALATFMGIGLAGCGSDDDDDAGSSSSSSSSTASSSSSSSSSAAPLLGFAAIAAARPDTILVPAGYTATPF